MSLISVPITGESFLDCLVNDIVEYQTRVPIHPPCVKFSPIFSDSYGCADNGSACPQTRNPVEHNFLGLSLNTPLTKMRNPLFRTYLIFNGHISKDSFQISMS